MDYGIFHENMMIVMYFVLFIEVFEEKHDALSNLARKKQTSISNIHEALGRNIQRTKDKW